MASLRRALSPAISSNSIPEKKQLHTKANCSRSHSLLEKTTGQVMMKNAKPSLLRTPVPSQPNAIKCLTDLEEYLEDVSPTSIYTNGRNNTQQRSASLPMAIDTKSDTQFWYDIRQQMLEIVELTCQTQDFNHCCNGEKTRMKHGCPFESSSKLSSTSSFPHSQSSINMRSSTSPVGYLATNDKQLYTRRGSSPVTFSTRSTASSSRRDSSLLNVSYGGFESIVSSFNDSAFTVEDDQDEIWSSESGNQPIFRRDLHVPVRRKKHHSSFPNITNLSGHSDMHQLLSVRESFPPKLCHTDD